MVSDGISDGSSLFHNVVDCLILQHPGRYAHSILPMFYSAGAGAASSYHHCFNKILHHCHHHSGMDDDDIHLLDDNSGFEPLNMAYQLGAIYWVTV